MLTKRWFNHTGTSTCLLFTMSWHLVNPSPPLLGRSGLSPFSPVSPSSSTCSRIASSSLSDSTACSLSRPASRAALKTCGRSILTSVSTSRPSLLSALMIPARLPSASDIQRKGGGNPVVRLGSLILRRGSSSSAFSAAHAVPSKRAGDNDAAKEVRQTRSSPVWSSDKVWMVASKLSVFSLYYTARRRTLRIKWEGVLEDVVNGQRRQRSARVHSVSAEKKKKKTQAESKCPMEDPKEITTSTSSSSSSSSPSRFFNGKPPRIQRFVIRAARERSKSVSFPTEGEVNIKGAREDGSPRCVLEENVRSSDSETGSSKASTSYPDAAVETKENPLWKGIVSILGKKSLIRLSSFPPFGVAKLAKKSNAELAQVSEPESTAGDDNLLIVDTSDHADLQPFFKPSWKNFTLSELRSATNDFSPENIIGMGGFAEVYKGRLEDDQLVAIKRLTQETDDERTQNFLSEIGIIVHVDHPNAARLVGVGVEGGMHLVFELSIHGSLEALLCDSGPSENKLDWGTRYKIALGAAKGLEYLHDKCTKRIIHRDIKAANILITDNFEPQIGDFGLAKWLPDKTSHLSISTLEGTFGYLAPEYCMYGIVDEKTDVFAYGVLLLELLTGRKAVDSEQRSLAMWAKPLLEHNRIKELIDPSLGDSYDQTQMKYVTETAHMCIQHLAALRPRMSQVIKLLQGEESRSEIMKARRTYSEEIFDAEEYNANRYLNDLRRHEQLALDF